jgi:cystathionine gamma-synthase
MTDDSARAQTPIHPETIAVSHGIGQDTAHGAVAPPLYLSTTYTFEGYDRQREYAYGRGGNPNRDMLGEALARLEGGAGAAITASGMAAFDLLLGQLTPDDHIVVPHDCYGGTLRLVNARVARRQFRATIVDQSDPAALADALAGAAALVLVETPSNPLMRIVDIAAIGAAAKRAGAKLLVDNTFLSPALQRPIALGADYVLHSTTKYLNGHSDVIGGAIVAADAGDAEALRAWANTTGLTGSPFDSWLTLRGLRTLFPRIERQSRNALELAIWLKGQPQVSAVHYPGLPDHPGHALARGQQSGFGAMMSFELAGGAPAVQRFVEAVGTFVLAESLGGIESLVSHPATMTHADMGAPARARAGIGDGLLRLSVGLEHIEDMIAGMARGLAAID